MAYRQTSFAEDEWFHCYTRSIDRKTVFQNISDYQRFLEALYLCNSDRPIQRSSHYKLSYGDFLHLERGAPFVAIGGYCLMPNHFHLLIQEIVPGGISKFMQKVGTSFSMYFNAKYQHIGNVFVTPFRAKHIDDDTYLQRVIQYIHLNPLELFEPDWKQGRINDLPSSKKKVEQYPYSSLSDYTNGKNRVEKNILNGTAMELFTTLPSFSDVIDDAIEYYAELPIL